MFEFVWNGPLRLAYEAARILDCMVAGGSLDNARSAVLEGKTRRQELEALDDAERFSLAHPLVHHAPPPTAVAH